MQGASVRAIEPALAALPPQAQLLSLAYLKVSHDCIVCGVSQVHGRNRSAGGKLSCASKLHRHYQFVVQLLSVHLVSGQLADDGSG